MSATESEPPFRLKLIPILVTIVLGEGLPYVAAYAAFFSAKALHLPLTPGDNLPWLFAQHGAQFAVALIAIAVLKYWLVPADYGLHLPRGKSYIWSALVLSTLLIVVVTVIDPYLRPLVHAPSGGGGLPLTKDNIWGWIFFEGVYVGPTEEVPFRALMVTYLAATMPGKLHIGRFNMNWAGIIVALLFGLAHISTFWSSGWFDGLEQQVCAIGLGLMYAYWLEKSKSIVAPMVGHNASDLAATLLQWFHIG